MAKKPKAVVPQKKKWSKKKKVAAAILITAAASFVIFIAIVIAMNVGGVRPIKSTEEQARVVGKSPTICAWMRRFIRVAKNAASACAFYPTRRKRREGRGPFPTRCCVRRRGAPRGFIFGKILIKISKIRGQVCGECRFNLEYLPKKDKDKSF